MDGLRRKDEVVLAVAVEATRLKEWLEWYTKTKQVDGPMKMNCNDAITAAGNAIARLLVAFSLSQSVPLFGSLHALLLHSF